MSSDFGYFGRFELYNITFENLESNRQQDLMTITFDCHAGIEVIYKRHGSEDIPIGEQLSLLGPVHSCLPYDPISFVFGDIMKPTWSFDLNYDEELKDGGVDGPISQYVYDPDSDSCAIVCYDLCTKGIDANLKFQYEDKEKGRALRITQGEIWTTTAGNSCTKRVVRSFGISETSTLKKEKRWLPNGKDEEFYPREKIKLDRSEIGVPMNTFIEVTVDLKYYFVPYKSKQSEKRSMGEICQTFKFDAPSAAFSTSEEVHLPADSVSGPKLLLEISWSDDLPLRTMNRISEIVAKYPDVYSPVEAETESDHSLRKLLTDEVKVASHHSSSSKEIRKVIGDSSSTKDSQS